ncbi:MAG: FGGY-family carbohydrate kinase [Spirochaetia bacterium]|nr:FGGY-family carbohydrate kinase [Spirochaetia bacterium]
MTKYNFLCADIGTTSLKAALVSDKGQVLSFSKIEFTSTDKSKIALEWFEALKESISALKKNQIESLSENENLVDSKTGTLNIDAICISGNGPTIVSEDGTTLLWNAPVDSSLIPDIKKILPPELSENFSHSLFLPRILAFKNLYKNQFEKQKIFSGPEYLIWSLSNSQITILPEERYEAAYWNDQVLTAIGGSTANKSSPEKNESTGINCPPSMGPFVKPGFNCGTITKEIASQLKISSSTKVIAGGPDFTVALIGTNTLQQGKLCNRAGSSEGLNWCTAKPVFASGIRTLPSVIPGLWNASILSHNSGDRIADCKQAYEKENNVEISFSQYIKLCLQEKDKNGAQILQELSDFFKDGISKLRTLSKENNIPLRETVMVTGGQAKNPLWLKHKAECSQINLATCEIPDSELIGDAVLASYGLGLYDSIQEAAEKMVKIKNVFTYKK